MIAPLFQSAAPRTDPSAMTTLRRSALPLSADFWTPLEGFSLDPVEPGLHELMLVLIMNDDSDQPYEPRVEDKVTITVE